MEEEDIVTEPTLNEMFGKVSKLLDYPTSSWKKIVEVDNDNACTASIRADKDILEFVESSKNFVDADSDDESKMSIMQLLLPRDPK
ncbi:SCAN domain-containing protein 3 [Trichonephila clavipes]|nr:SCAN domain-containing protein 3 [Trichonephila clavipes]